MGGDRLIVRARPGETRIVRAGANGRLKDYALYRDDHAVQVGDVFWARVKSVVPNLEAAFVDLGEDRDGFLSLADARPQPHMGGEIARDRISDYVHEGEAVMVQILATARDDKGAKLTRRVNVSGGYLILTPGDHGVRVSKRIGEDGERNRLRALLTGHLKPDEGCVIRSAAAGLAEKAILADLNVVRAVWADLKARAQHAQPPQLLSDQTLPATQYVMETGRDGLAGVVIDDGAQADQLSRELTTLGLLPASGIELHKDHTDIFDANGVRDAVDALLSPYVGLPGGGSLVIEETTALCTIDVNAGRAGAKGGDIELATNLEAVKEAARQMRLRNLGGLIVIDLIGMRGKDSAGRVVTALKDAVATDPAGPQILGTTRGGLLEVTRPRRRPPLSAYIHARCPVCGSPHGDAPLHVGYRALDQVLADVWAEPSLVPCLVTTKAVAEALNSDGSAALQRVEAKLGQSLDVRVEDGMMPNTYRIEPI